MNATPSEGIRLGRRLVSGRAKVLDSGKPLFLGEESAITVSVPGSAVRRIMVHLSGKSMADACGSADTGEADQNASAKTFVIKLNPQCTGTVGLQLVVSFTDGSLEIDNNSAVVVANKPPVSLEPDPAGTTGAIVRMDLSRLWHSEYLHFVANYAGVKRSVSIPASDVRFKVLQSHTEAAIDFDPQSGHITAKRVGRANIVSTYKGLMYRTCVLVTENSEYVTHPLACNPVENETATPTIMSSLPYTATDRRRGRFVADERIELLAPTSAMHLAEDNLIEVALRQGTVARIECTTETTEPCEPWNGKFARASLTLFADPTGRKYIHVFAPELGQKEFRFLILFADGGVALKTVKVRVEDGHTPPRSIGNICAKEGNRKRMLPIRLLIGTPKGLEYQSSWPLDLFACYDGIRQPILLRGSPATYEISGEGKQAVVQLEPVSGKVTGLRVGQAVILEHYHGQTAAQCVVVVPWSRRQDSSVSDCSSLRDNQAGTDVAR